MSKIIIHNSKCSDLKAINLVQSVILDGLVSNNNTQYCYITTFTNNITGGKTVVSCDKRNDTHTFKVFYASH